VGDDAVGRGQAGRPGSDGASPYLRRGFPRYTGQGFNQVLIVSFTQLEETADSWEISLGTTEHRLEAYATLVFRTIERSLRTILRAIPVSPRWRRDGVNVA
jgi:hypothetical protein